MLPVSVECSLGGLVMRAPTLQSSDMRIRLEELGEAK